MESYNLKFTIQNVPIKSIGVLKEDRKEKNLQYRMFLLNVVIWNFFFPALLFTIQNVPIKLRNGKYILI